MKQSQLVRKTPLKSSGFSRKEPMGQVGLVAAPRKVPSVRKPMKSKQRAVTTEEKELWNRLAALGCCACLLDGVFEPDVSIHHVDGRTKEGCHKLVLPLCASHHQDGTGKNPHYVAVHPWKTRFEDRYGTQTELMARCAALLEALK